MVRSNAITYLNLHVGCLLASCFRFQLHRLLTLHEMYLNFYSADWYDMRDLMPSSIGSIRVHKHYDIFNRIENVPLDCFLCGQDNVSFMTNHLWAAYWRTFVHIVFARSVNPHTQTYTPDLPTKKKTFNNILNQCARLWKWFWIGF